VTIGRGGQARLVRAALGFSSLVLAKPLVPALGAAIHSR